MTRRRCRPTHSAVLAALLVAVLVGTPGFAQTSNFQVIAHPSVPLDEIDADELSRVFLKKTERWSDGSRIVPTDQVEMADVRGAFSRDVHGRAVAAIKAYWQQRIFSGREVPPPEQRSDRNVLEFVRSTPGAIGYVSAGVPLQGVKAIEVLE